MYQLEHGHDGLRLGRVGPQLYYVDDDGTRLKGDAFCVGSGSTTPMGSSIPI